MAEGSGESVSTNINNSSVFCDISNQQQDDVFALLTDMFGDILVPEIVHKICIAYKWNVDRCIEQLIQHIEDHGTSSPQELINVEKIKSSSPSDNISNLITSDTITTSQALTNTNECSDKFSISPIKKTQPFEDQADVITESETALIDLITTMNHPEHMENQKADQASKFLGAIPKNTQKYSQNTSKQYSFNFSGLLKRDPKELPTTKFNSPTISKNQQSLNSSYFDKIVEQIQNGYKVLVIMRGAPGSGKSYLARSMIDKTVKADYRNFIFSADDYFYDVRGKYIYNPDKIQDAHEFAQKRVKQKAAAGWSPIIVDNTNIRTWEMSPYVRTAVQYGYSIEILQPNNSWSNSAGKLALKNSHRVRKEVIVRMLQNFENITVEELLKINNEVYQMKMPQLRHKPPIPIEVLNKHMTDISLDNKSDGSSDKTTETPVEISKWSTYEADEVPKQTNSILELPKPPRNLLKRQRSPTKQDSVDISLTEAISKIEPQDVDWKNYQEESMQFWQTKGKNNSNHNKSREEEVSKPQRDIFKLPTVEQNICAILKEQVKENSPKKEEPENPIVDIRLVKHKVGCKNESQSFITMRQIYSNRQVEGLWDLFEKCNGNMDWAIDLLLKDDSCVEIQNSNDCDSTSMQCTCDDEVQEINIIDTDSKDAQSDYFKSSRQKIKRDKTNFLSNEMLEAKKAIERQFILRDDCYSRHVKKIRNIRHGGIEEMDDLSALNLVQNEPIEDKTLVDDINLDNKDNDENGSSELDNDEMIEIDLGKDLINQLQGMFVEDSSPEHNINNFKTNVFMPKSLAKQLYAIWMESLYNQMEEQRHTILKEDEEFARLLEKYQKFGKSNQPNTQCDFNEIMDMELAWQIYKSELEDNGDIQKPQDLIKQMTILKLSEIFPNVDKNTLSQVLTAHDNKFMETVAVLKNSLKPKIDDKLERKETQLLEDVKKESDINRNQSISLKDSESTINNNNNNQQQQKSEPKLSSEDAKKAAIKDFEDSRNLAIHHSQLKGECYHKAKEAIQKHNTAAAIYYSQIANLHKSKIEIFNHKAANCIMEVNDLQQNNPDFIDLHYLHVSEALECLDIFIDKHINKMRNISRNYKHIFIITGRGLHSSGGVSTIKNRVKYRLKERNLKWYEVNPGLLKAKIYSNAKYSNNLH